MAGAKTLSRPALTPRSLGDRAGGGGWDAPEPRETSPARPRGPQGPVCSHQEGDSRTERGRAPKLSEPRFSLLRNGDNNAARVRVF